MPRKVINASSYYVPVRGFTQAVAAPANGRFIFISGITARGPNDAIVGVGDLAAQTRQIYENLKLILAEAGGTLDDVVRIVTYLRDMREYRSMENVRREYLGESPPASTTVEISRLFHPDQLIEVEATAVLSPSAS